MINSTVASTASSITNYVLILSDGSDIQSFTVPIVGAPNWDEWLEGWRGAGYELLTPPIKL